VSIAVLDEQEGSGGQGDGPAVNGRAPPAFDHVEPLVGASMPVVSPAFLATGREHHRGGLCAAVRDPDMETGPQAETLAFHRGVDATLVLLFLA